MGKKIYIIRHGQTDYNKMGMVQGSGIDASLNDLGRLQAQTFHEAYKDMPFEKIYISTLKRTSESVSAFLEDGIPYKKLSGLNEISWGEQEGKSVTLASKRSYQDMLMRWQSGKVHESLEGGESPVQVMERQKEAIDYILAQEEEQLVLICMHGRAMRILLAWISGIPLSEMDQFEHKNLCLYILDYTDGKISIEVRNHLDHLKAIEAT